MAEITINLDNSLYTNSFSENERIHGKAFARAKQLIDSQIRVAEEKYGNEPNELNFLRQYNTISILGERGVGKTSFLMSLTEEYKAKEDVAILPIIDPTLFEEKGHLFLLIITLIDDQVSKVKDQGNIEDVQGYIDKYDEVKAQLAQGLPTLDSEGMTYTEPQWHEDEYMMVRGMESVRSAFYLELHFHQLVHYALRIIKKKAFMLFLDDIDVDFRRGWMVLETLRKFLTTQQIIIVLSGNFKLYQKNVRKQQWKNFGESLLINERDKNYEGRRSYEKLVDEIEGQYLQKVLKSENRVFLYTMQDNIVLNGDKYFVIKHNKDESKGLESVYRNIFDANGIHGQAEIRIFSNFLMSTSIRTQVHFLKTTYANDEKDNILSRISALASRIYAQNVDIEMATSAERYNVILLRYLVNQRIIEEAYQLLPTFDSTDTNSVLTGFTFIFAKLYPTSPFLPFDYWDRICLARNNMHFLSYDNNQKNYVINYCKGAGLFQSRDLKSIVGNSMAYITSLLSLQRLDGAIPLMGFGFRSKGRNEENDRRIDKVLENATGLQRILGYLPLVTLMGNNNARMLHYSIYYLIANIGQILKADDDNIRLTIRAACTPVSYQVLPDVNQMAESTSQDSEPEVDPKIDDDALTKLSDAFKNWRKQFYDKFSYAPYMFGRISTRFYFSLANIVQNNSDKNLGEIFNLFVASLINSCLIEEMKEIGQSRLQGVNYNNVSTSTLVLANNIHNIADINLSFTKWIASCPLLYPFLSPSNHYDIKNFIIESCGDNKLPDELFTEEGCLVHVLDKISWNKPKKSIEKNKFSANNNYIDETIRLINENELDGNRILNGTVHDAKETLSPIFGNVNSNSLKIFKEKCRLVDGKITLNN